MTAGRTAGGLKFKAWQKTSLIEYPGRLSTVLFVGGCNFRCPFCYNASLVLDPASTPDLPSETVLEYLREHRSLYEAAVVTGGEPTLAEGLPGFLEGIKSLGLLAGLETNGSRPGLLGRLLRERLVDFVAMDLKGALGAGTYRKAAGLAEAAPQVLEAVRETLGLLAEAPHPGASESGPFSQGGAHPGPSGVEVELRCTVVPGIHNLRGLRRLGGELAAIGFRRLVLQQFRPEAALDPALRQEAPYSGEALEGFRRKVVAAGLECSIRGA